MKLDKKVLLSSFAVLVVATVTAALNNQSRRPETHDQRQKAEVDESQWLIADYDAPEPPDPEVRSLRKLRSRRYDGINLIRESTTAVEAATVNHIHYPALPVADSDAVVLGQVVDAQAHLSNDKGFVYSEFNARVEEVLMNNRRAPLTPGGLIAMERPGGRVRFPSGRIMKHSVDGQGMLRAGRQYVLFLKSHADQDTYRIVTAYELRGEKVFPVDGSVVNKVSQKWSFDVYQGAGRARFLKDVRDAIANPTGEKGKMFG